jgi:hypothetical protein
LAWVWPGWGGHHSHHDVFWKVGIVVAKLQVGKCCIIVFIVDFVKIKILTKKKEKNKSLL